MNDMNQLQTAHFVSAISLKRHSRCLAIKTKLFILIYVLLGSLYVLAQMVPMTGESEKLLDAYRQGEANNCGSVATTKLVSALFGVAPSSGPFSAILQPDHSHAVLLADGKRRVFVTDDQFSRAREESKFKPQESREAEFANFLYAVMAVSMTSQQVGRQVTDGRTVSNQDYESALGTLYEGGDDADADTLLLLLGFQFEDHSDGPYLPAIYLLGSSRHVAYVQGNLYDEHGLSGGNDVNEFRRIYGNRRREEMYRYFPDTSTNASNHSTIIRQCSIANKNWVLNQASWTQRSDCPD